MRQISGWIGFVLLAACPWEARAATYMVASCNAADVQGAVAGASDGDMLLVPAGNCTWGTVVTISVGLTLSGQGATVNFSAGSGLQVTTDSVASTVITGFTFNNGFVNGSYPIELDTRSSPLNAPFRFYNNSLNDNGQQGGPVTLLGVTGFGPGLIDHNTLTTAAGADEVIHLLGSGSPSDSSGWSNDVMPGGPNMIFLENNVFTNTNGTYLSEAEEAYYGAQFVFRYNQLSFEANDIHQGGLSGRWAEIYDNAYGIAGTTNNLADYWSFRGGSGLVFDNIASGTPCCQDPYPGAQFGPDCPSSDVCTGAWPIPTQVGTGINETTHSPAYVWGNTATVKGATQDIQGALGYTNGTQAGATPTSCTHPGNVCDVVVPASSPSSWLRCESAADVAAGCPVSYAYTPYTYPHPLDNLPASCFGAGCPGGTSATSTSSGAASTSGGTSSSGTGSSSSGANSSGSVSATSSTVGTTSSRASTGSTAAASGAASSSGGTSSSASTGGTTGSAATSTGGSAGSSGCGCGVVASGDGALLSLALAGWWRRRRRPNRATKGRRCFRQE